MAPDFYQGAPSTTEHFRIAASRRALAGVLSGFLGTYCSRYSDYQGYLLFGFLVADLERLEFDLQKVVASDGTPVNFAHVLAHAKFWEQLHKHKLPDTTVRDATLTLERSSGQVERMSGDHRRCGYEVRFRAVAVADTGKRFERVKVVFVAPHDSRLEYRSGRAPA